MLNLENLSLYIDDKLLIDNINLKIAPGEVHVLMGRNGIGKSSIAKSIMGDKNYTIKGHIYYNNEDITNLDIYERSKRGIYIINQNPVEIEGVTNAEMLRSVLSDKNTSLNIIKFNKELENICEKLDLDKSFIHRDINVSCSGGEKKKIELMHMWIIKPSFIILDEIDSGLDVDALKLVANSIKEYLKEYNPGILIITHSLTLVDTFDNYYVHLLEDKKIVASGDKLLAKEILEKGFKEIITEIDEHLL